MKKLVLSLLFLTSSAFADKITATSWIVADGNGKVIESQNAAETRSIASITKLMTAMVILDANQDMNETLLGFTRKEHLQMMLIKSNNRSADILCENYPRGRSSCIHSMNSKSEQLGLSQTKFADPSGLNIMNISTAEELVNIVIASSKYPEIVEASNMPQGKAKKKKGWITFNNTNPLVATKDFIVSKTGYIRASGGCIVTMIDTDLGRRIVVLLNSKDTRTRIPESYKLAVKF
jgi:D-alanyl-D-alanine endopeptidase (penicillin-binding protein 7)